jgi:hypothetical protein
VSAQSDKNDKQQKLPIPEFAAVLFSVMLSTGGFKLSAMSHTLSVLLSLGVTFAGAEKLTNIKKMDE